MYIPKAFQQDDQDILFDLMRQYNFAALVTQNNSELCATHLPFYLDAEHGSHGTLVAHMARANPQWQSFAADQEALVIFQGPHVYITPSWYEAAPTNVPTWNMAVVHAYGVPHIIEDHDALYALLQRLVQENEAGFETPWQIEASAEYVHKAIPGIVGFEIPITRLEGKFKLSQNRTETDQQRVIAALSDRADEHQVASLMRREQIRRSPK